MNSLKEKLEESAAFIKKQIQIKPKVGIILGSGLGPFVKEIEKPLTIAYNQIPHFQKVTVKGHEGKIIFGRVRGVDIVALQGRFHYYEGYDLSDVVYPVRLLKKLGIDILIVTNAAGGVNLSYKAGDLAIITDHLNLTGKNPLLGPNDDSIGPRFPDMTHAYNEKLITILEETGLELNIPLQKGVYAGVIGPTYETPAEIKMFRVLGGDMVGMSTVPEVIVAHHMGLKVCGISCITNMGAGIFNQELNHDDIKDEALKVMDSFTKLLTHSIAKLKEV